MTEIRVLSGTSPQFLNRLSKPESTILTVCFHGESRSRAWKSNIESLLLGELLANTPNLTISHLEGGWVGGSLRSSHKRPGIVNLVESGEMNIQDLNAVFKRIGWVLLVSNFENATPQDLVTEAVNLSKGQIDKDLINQVITSVLSGANYTISNSWARAAMQVVDSIKSGSGKL